MFHHLLTRNTTLLATTRSRFVVVKVKLVVWQRFAVTYIVRVSQYLPYSSATSLVFGVTANRVCGTYAAVIES